MKPPRDTALSRELTASDTSKRVRPLDAFHLARQKWINGERIEIGALAAELGIGKTTLFRWVGSRELLHAEIVWNIFDAMYKQALASTEGNGADYVATICYTMMNAMVASVSLRKFVDQDPDFGRRILISSTSPFQQRMIAAMRKTLQVQVDAGHLSPALPVDDLGYVIVRISEAFIYYDQFAEREPNTEIARETIRILLSAAPEKVASLSSRF